jgi:hypothetical protein
MACAQRVMPVQLHSHTYFAGGAMCNCTRTHTSRAAQFSVNDCTSCNSQVSHAAPDSVSKQNKTKQIERGNFAPSPTASAAARGASRANQAPYKGSGVVHRGAGVSLQSATAVLSAVLEHKRKAQTSVFAWERIRNNEFAMLLFIAPR